MCVWGEGQRPAPHGAERSANACGAQIGDFSSQRRRGDGARRTQITATEALRAGPVVRHGLSPTITSSSPHAAGPSHRRQPSVRPGGGARAEAARAEAVYSTPEWAASLKIAPSSNERDGCRAG